VQRQLGEQKRTTPSEQGQLTETAEEREPDAEHQDAADTGSERRRAARPP